MRGEQAEDVWMPGERTDGIDRDGPRRRAEEKDGKRRAVCDGLKGGHKFKGLSGREDSWRADEDCVVAVPSGELGKIEHRGDAVPGEAGDEDLLWGGSVSDRLQGFAGLGVVEERGLAGGAEDDQPGRRAARVAR